MTGDQEYVDLAFNMNWYALINNEKHISVVVLFETNILYRTYCLLVIYTSAVGRMMRSTLEPLLGC